MYVSTNREREREREREEGGRSGGRAMPPLPAMPRWGGSVEKMLLCPALFLPILHGMITKGWGGWEEAQDCTWG